MGSEAPWAQGVLSLLLTNLDRKMANQTTEAEPTMTLATTVQPTKAILRTSIKELSNADNPFSRWGETPSSPGIPWG